MATEARFSSDQPVHQLPTPKEGNVERPPVGPWAAVLHHPLLFILVFLACTGAGIVVGLGREPVYTAEARLSVGNVDVTSQSLPGYVAATQSLAGSYSRAIDSEGVIVPLARQLGQPPAAVAARLTASPVPQSSIIRVEATAGSAEAAVALVNAGSRSLVRYVRRLDESAKSGERALTEYRASEIAVIKAQRTARLLTARYVAAPTSALRAKLQSANADLSAVKLQGQALAARYQSEQQRSPTQNFVQSLGAATTASSDRTSALQLRALSGAVAGLLLGAALAVALANRRRARDV